MLDAFLKYLVSPMRRDVPDAQTRAEVGAMIINRARTRKALRRKVLYKAYLPGMFAYLTQYHCGACLSTHYARTAKSDYNIVLGGVAPSCPAMKTTSWRTS